MKETKKQNKGERSIEECSGDKLNSKKGSGRGIDRQKAVNIRLVEMELKKKSK